MKLWYSIKAKATDSTVATVDVFEEIGIWGISGKRFADDLKAQIKGKKSIELRVNSIGGSVFDAVVMFNALKETGLPIAVTVMGLAASAASYLAMAGDTIEMPDNTFMMVHNPISGVYGNANDMRDMADILEKVGGQLMNTYETRTGQPRADLQKLFDAESYLTAAECKELGLCDTVIPAVKIAAAFDLDRPDVPEAVKKVLATAADPEPEVDPEPEPKTDPEPEPEPAQPEATLADKIKASAERLGLGEFISVFALDATLATIEQAETAMSVAREVQSLCLVADVKDMAPSLIKERKTLPEARAAILAKLAGAADANHTSNVPKPKTPAAKTPAAKAPFNPASYWNSTTQQFKS